MQSGKWSLMWNGAGLKKIKLWSWNKKNTINLFRLFEKSNWELELGYFQLTAQRIFIYDAKIWYQTISMNCKRNYKWKIHFKSEQLNLNEGFSFLPEFNLMIWTLTHFSFHHKTVRNVPNTKGPIKIINFTPDDKQSH